jgi:amphi-Trp domain-containing protein
METEMSSAEKIRFDARLTLNEAAQQLEDLAKGLRSGSVLLEAGDEAMELTPPDEVKLDLYVEAQPAKRKARLEVSLTWRSAEEPPSPRELVIRGRDDGVPQSLSRNGATTAAARGARDAKKGAAATD